MLGWIFKQKTDKRTAAATPPAGKAGRATAAGAAAPAAQRTGSVPATAPNHDEAHWRSRLQAAAGQDDALLAIALQAPLVAVKLDAVAALTEEAALRQAEREFRSHDRRVHRVAKQRLEQAVARRQTRAQAEQLIAAAQALLTQSTLPTNRLVELDRAWQALDTQVLDPSQAQHYRELTQQLTTLAHQRGEHEQQVTRWLQRAAQTRTELRDIARQAAAPSEDTSESSTTAALEQAIAAAQALQAQAPAEPTCTGAAAALADALQLSQAVASHLAWLAAWPWPQGEPAAADEVAAVTTTTATATATTTTATATATATTAAQPDWHTLPAVADAQIAAALQRRHQAGLAARRAVAAPASPTSTSAEADHPTPPRRAGQRKPRPLDVEALTALVQRAEAALEGGHVGQVHEALVAADKALDGAMAPAALHSRLQSLQAETARLKGWQHWGGGRARDDLVQEAETLATATAAALADPMQAAKMPVQALAELIDSLRQRWKEIDRLGGASNQTLWLRFDHALKAAYEPVAAHQAQLKIRRNDNLAARQQLLATLDAQAVPEPDTNDAGSSAWKDVARALESFQVGWRKLGPVEHTVPHKARAGLLSTLQLSVARLEQPLSQLREAAQAERQTLVQRAQALATEATPRDPGPALRELQAAWQQHAKTLPLARNVETALWKDFRAASDAVMAKREASHQAHDAELMGNQARREAMIERLEALGADTPADTLKRILAEADAEWRVALQVPRAQVQLIEARFRNAVEAARHCLSDRGRLAWHASCDALQAGLSGCEALERGEVASDTTTAEPWAALQDRWTASATLPSAWGQALTRRRDRALAPPQATTARGGRTGSEPAELDARLLQLEAALSLPSPPAFEQARRNLKLQAMKAALEQGRTAQATGPHVQTLVAEALEHGGSTPEQGERLAAIVTALKMAGLP